MPKELEGYVPQPIEGMTELSLSKAYNDVWTALESGLTPGQFRNLACLEQAELTAFHYVKGLINGFYYSEREAIDQRRRQEMESKARARR